jgi:hypothetical protein
MEKHTGFDEEREFGVKVDWKVKVDGSLWSRTRARDVSLKVGASYRALNSYTLGSATD